MPEPDSLREEISKMKGDDLAAAVIDAQVITLKNTPGASLRNVLMLEEVAKRLRKD